MVERITPNDIKELKANEIFVFGSNLQGEHVGGAAKFALDRFGAVNGCGFGLQGRSYAIPTCFRLNHGKLRITKPFENIETIGAYIRGFEYDVIRYPNFNFFVTKIGCGIAGFKVADVAKLFKPLAKYENVFLPKEFWDEYTKE